MTVNSNTSINLFKEYFGCELRPVNGAGIASAKREFSESVQAALSSGLNSRDLQAILDSVLRGGVNSKEVQ